MRSLHSRSVWVAAYLALVVSVAVPLTALGHDFLGSFEEAGSIHLFLRKAK